MNMLLMNLHNFAELTGIVEPIRVRLPSILDR